MKAGPSTIYQRWPSLRCVITEDNAPILFVSHEEGWLVIPARWASARRKCESADSRIHPFAMTTVIKKQTFHATMLVTRAEEWCVEAKTLEEAKALLESGEGHRCSLGEIFCVELGEIALP
jgi:hypothetical protein